MEAEIDVSIDSDEDMVLARAESRALAQKLGFSRTDATIVATAISEIVRNILVHAGQGLVTIGAVREEDRYGLVVVASDQGPGIQDVARAIQVGYGRFGGFGLGLPGVRRLMDEFEIDSEPGEGTTVRMIKWRMRDELERLREKRLPSSDSDQGQT